MLKNQALNSKKIINTNDSYQIREPNYAYSAHFISVPHFVLEEIVRGSDNESRIDWKPIMVKSKFINIKQPRGKERNQFWFKFNDLYPNSGGYYSVSKVAFDTKSKDAVMVYSYSCAVLCGGHDSLLHLRKVGSKWALISGVRLWVS